MIKIGVHAPITGAAPIPQNARVFMLFGVTGSDQITACARHADAAGVPYLSAGVNEDGLTGLKNYFAVSQTYAQQNRTIVGLIKNVMHKTRIAIVLNATPALDETQRSITALTQAGGLKIVRQSRISKQASDAELVSEANQLRASGTEHVSPIWFSNGRSPDFHRYEEYW